MMGGTSEALYNRRTKGSRADLGGGKRRAGGDGKIVQVEIPVDDDDGT